MQLALATSINQPHPLASPIFVYSVLQVIMVDRQQGLAGNWQFVVNIYHRRRGPVIRWPETPGL